MNSLLLFVHYGFLDIQLIAGDLVGLISLIFCNDLTQMLQITVKEDIGFAAASRDSQSGCGFHACRDVTRRDLGSFLAREACLCDPVCPFLWQLLQLFPCFFLGQSLLKGVYLLLNSFFYRIGLVTRFS